MGVLSTLCVTRAAAERAVYNKLLLARFYGLWSVRKEVTDDMLGRILDALLEPHYVNIMIVAGDQENDNHALDCLTMP